MVNAEKVDTANEVLSVDALMEETLKQVYRVTPLLKAVNAACPLSAKFGLQALNHFDRD